MNNDLISRSELLKVVPSEEIVARMAIMSAPTVEQPTNEWVPVSERLPDDRKDTYWVCTDGEYQCECRWTNVDPFLTYLKTDWHWCIFDIPQYQKVIAWQSLPKPYKEAENDLA